MYIAVQFKSVIKQTGIWSAVAWSPHDLCECPAIFFHHLCVTVLSFLLGKIQWGLKIFLSQYLFYFFKKLHVWNCMTCNSVRWGVSVLSALKWQFFLLGYSGMGTAFKWQLKIIHTLQLCFLHLAHTFTLYCSVHSTVAISSLGT